MKMGISVIAILLIALACGGPASSRRGEKAFHAKTYQFDNPVVLPVPVDEFWSLVINAVEERGAKIGEADKQLGVIKLKRFQVDPAACECHQGDPKIIGERFAEVSLTLLSADENSTSLTIDSRFTAKDRTNSMMHKRLDCRSSGLIESNLIDSIQRSVAAR